MFTPLNRHIHIDLGTLEQNETATGILLPDEYKPTENRHATATVVAASEDVKFLKSLRKGTQIVIDKTMVEEINFGGKTINVILENYILGIIS
jgi:co-chaperonin GroES (HSP10)